MIDASTGVSLSGPRFPAFLDMVDCRAVTKDTLATFGKHLGNFII